MIHGDIFTAWMKRLAFTSPWRLPLLLWWLLHGRAHAKLELARRYPVNAALLPYNEPFLAWLRAQHAAGRPLALATACDRSAAEAVAAHLGIFTFIVASEGRRNIKSRLKAAALAAAYPGGFAYAGNERADLRVWTRAAAAVLVNVSGPLRRRARRLFAIEADFPRQPADRQAIARALAAAVAPAAQQPNAALHS